MNSSMNILIVILHYGETRQTTALHEQLLVQNSGHSQIKVLDNASPQPYAQAWQRTEQNLYWAGALDFSLNYAQQKGFSHLWFLNNDIYFLTNKNIIDYAGHRLRHIESQVGPVAIYSPAAKTNPYHPQMVFKPGGQFQIVRYVDGIAPLINVKFWTEAGLDFSDNPYGYGVDIWFSSQAHTFGFSCVVDHQVILRHRYHSSARKVEGFLEKAATAEQRYLQHRFGMNYQSIITKMAQDIHLFSTKDHYGTI